MEQIFIIVYGHDITDINKLLNKGWVVQNMSACGFQWDNQGASLCYVHLVRHTKNLNK